MLFLQLPHAAVQLFADHQPTCGSIARIGRFLIARCMSDDKDNNGRRTTIGDVIDLWNNSARVIDFGISLEIFNLFVAFGQLLFYRRSAVYFLD